VTKERVRTVGSMAGIGPPPAGPPGAKGPVGNKPNPHQNRALHVTGIRYSVKYRHAGDPVDARFRSLALLAFL
jgi:hypothetical protein